MEPKRLNLGCGTVKLDGYENLDLSTGTDARDLSAFPDCGVDEVRASHLL